MTVKQRSKLSGKSPPVSTDIGKRLRTYYDQIASEPIPDRFVELLRQLDEKDDGQGPR